MKFCKFFKKIADYQSGAQGISKSVSNVIDLYQNTEIEGGGESRRPLLTLLLVNQTSASIGLMFIILKIYNLGFPTKVTCVFLLQVKPIENIIIKHF